MKNYGKLDVYAGSMFAGKTSEILKRILWARAGQKLDVIVFKPKFDNRYAESEIVSHDGLRSSAIPISIWDPDARDTARHADLVVFDEIQFFDAPNFDGDIVLIIQELLRAGVHIVVSGLDMDWQGKPFKTTSLLLGMADEVHKLKANCTVCGRLAGKTYKKSASGGSVELGATDKYEARCNEHWNY